MAALEDWMRQAKVTREEVAKRSGHEPGYVLAMFDESEPNPKLKFYLDLLEAAGARMETAGGNTTGHVVSRINELRNLCELNIAELARKAGMHRPHLSRIINDNNPNMQLAVFDALVDALGAYRELRLVARNFTSRMPLALAAGAETMSSVGPPPPPRTHLHAVTGIPPERRSSPEARAGAPRPTPLPPVNRPVWSPGPPPPASNTSRAPGPPPPGPPPPPDPRLIAAEGRVAQEKARADAANSRADAAFASASQERARREAEEARLAHERARLKDEQARAQARVARIEDQLRQERLDLEAELTRAQAQSDAALLDADGRTLKAMRERDEARRLAERERQRVRELESDIKITKTVGLALASTGAVVGGIFAYDRYTKRSQLS